MKVLIIGLSSIVKRRVLPALQGIAEVERIDVATRKADDEAVRSGWSQGDAYEDYSEAIRRTPAELVYVSLVNSEHERWVHRALEQGMHVVVDKPGFLGLEPSMRMAELAVKQDRCLAEATVFAYHPQVAAARQLFAQASDAPLRIVAVLSFPPMDPSNFRYQQALGGGAMWDLGPYLVAASRVFFDAEPLQVDCRVLARREDGLEMAFSAMGAFSDGRSLAGHFGFDTAYVNRLHVIGRSVDVEADRMFTTPPDYANSIRVGGEGVPPTLQVPAADAFSCFFEHVLGRIKAHDWSRLVADLVIDSRVLERYRAAARAA